MCSDEIVLAGRQEYVVVLPAKGGQSGGGSPKNEQNEIGCEKRATTHHAPGTCPPEL